MKKKLLFLLVTLLLFLLALLVFFLNVQSKMSNVKSPSTTLILPTPTLPNPDQENQTTTIYYQKDAPFAITLSNVTGAYLISILQSPFEEVRQIAETAFLEKLNIDKVAACKLKVNITTMRFANPDQAGQTFHLSFCPNQ